MRTRLISCDDPQAVEAALLVLKAGGLVAFPTDTVYGLAASVLDKAGIDRLYEAKKRSASKAIAVLVGDLDQLEQVTQTLPEGAQRLAEAFFPGALTLVVPRRPDLPENLSPGMTVGVRMPDHEFARRLLRATGALAVTSANLSGGENPRTAEEVMAQLEGRVELVLDGGSVPGGVPSTVVDCTGKNPVILREGAVPAGKIFQVWGVTG
jgi:L-threonylcarbamoyladenylate synthase